MANTIQIKRSSTASDTPSASDLAVGELAVNTADAKLFTKHTDGTVKELAGGGGGGGGSVALDDITTGDAASTLATTAGNITIDAQGNNTDIIFKGTDNTADITFLTMDGSETTLLLGEGVKIQSQQVGGTKRASLEFASVSTTTSMIIPNENGTLIFKDLSDNVQITSTNTGASEDPTLELYRNSSSPTDGDVLGEIHFFGNDEGGTKTKYAEIKSIAGSEDNGNERGQLQFNLVQNGTEDTQFMSMGFNLIQFFKNPILRPNVNIQFEGSSDDANETTLTVTDPTADRTITLPDATGTVLLADGDGSSLTNVNATTLDSVDSTSFLRSDAADTKTSGDLTFSDDVNAIFGDGSDLSIRHISSSGHSLISESGSGNLFVRATNLTLDSADGEPYLRGIANGAVELYHDNSKKIETTSTGVTITGNPYIIGDQMVFEGATSSSHELFIQITDPTADRTITLPDQTGTAMVAVFYDSYLSSNQTLSTSYSTIDFDTNRQNSDTEVFSESAGEVTIAKAGVYLMMFQLTIGNTSTSRSEGIMRLQRKASGGSFAEVAGSTAQTYHRNNAQDATEGSVTLMYTVTAGDVFRVQAKRNSGNGSLRADGNGCRFNIMALKIG